ncbi:T6SS immunity protein Tli4 family protein [Massilia niabensis]|uniref:T6SS immunity protein Tli4 family protein n=1 Tax=Massilia niabensis TaxID=544910 RepID=A0ABW0L773_9BURK
MKHWIHNKLAKVPAGIVIAALATAWALGAVLNEHGMARQDRHEVVRMTEKMKTVCVGRFLLDLPKEAQITFSTPRIDGFTVVIFPETLDEFQTRLAEREALIKAKPDRLGGDRNLEVAKEVRGDGGMTGKLLVHSRAVKEGTASNGLEIERYRHEGVAVEALMHGNGVSVNLASDFYFPDMVGNVLKLAVKLVPNPENKVPAEPGFCMDGAYLRDPLTADQLEQITMFARLPSNPDIRFLLILAAGLQPDKDGLIERDAATKSQFSPTERMRFSRLRAAPRTIGGIYGEEVVKRVHELNDSIVYSFWWEVAGTTDNIFVPHIVFQMDTGEGDHGPVPSSLSEGAAMGMWDRISSSIRVRPTQPPERVAAESPPTPLGSYAWAGERCPESGWWQCSDGGNGIGVLGGQRQYIRKGERMPQALLLPPQTLWEKLRGVQPSFESKTQTSWKLVDKRSRKRVPSPLPLAQATPVAAAGITSAGTGPSVMEQQGVAVGSFAATGLPCPASGWWLCDDPRALDGTRWFARGSLLPPATFALPPGGFSRSANSAKSIERRGAWRLVRLADAPEQAASDDNGKLA